MACFGNEKLNDSLVSGRVDKRDFRGREETAAMFKDNVCCRTSGDGGHGIVRIYGTYIYNCEILELFYFFSVKRMEHK